jgi:phytoene dehydrogenase-like protein
MSAARREVVVIGAGMGGLCAAIHLKSRNFAVKLLEARSEPGGLAGGFELEGLPFDAGPYILLDRRGLQWAFGKLGLALEDRLDLRRIDDVYQVESRGAGTVRFSGSLDATAAGFEARWPGSGPRYRRFVERMLATYRRLEPLQRVARPGIGRLLAVGAWRDLPFLSRPLRSVLAAAGLPPPLAEAIGIWTHVAGQRTADAPAPLAFVPALIHHHGAYYPRGGIAAIPRLLAAEAIARGVEVRLGTRVKRIRVRGGRTAGVETDAGEHFPAEAVVAGSGGVGVYLDILEETPAAARRRLEDLPLQSPGVCAYLAVMGATPPPYLRFHLPGDGRTCRLLVTPSAASPEMENRGWRPARLLAPMDHRIAETGGPAAQAEFLEEVLSETWWKQHVPQHRVLTTRTPREWGAEYHLHRDSMNPVMTARFMRAGRLAHRSPHVRGLYLAGSATHPGQWVSFCAISGVLAAEQLEADLG